MQMQDSSPPKELPYASHVELSVAERVLDDEADGALGSSREPKALHPNPATCLGSRFASAARSANDDAVAVVHQRFGFSPHARIAGVTVVLEEHRDAYRFIKRTPHLLRNA